MRVATAALRGSYWHCTGIVVSGEKSQLRSSSAPT